MDRCCWHGIQARDVCLVCSAANIQTLQVEAPRLALLAAPADSQAKSNAMQHIQIWPGVHTTAPCTHHVRFRPSEQYLTL